LHPKIEDLVARGRQWLEMMATTSKEILEMEITGKKRRRYEKYTYHCEQHRS